MSYVADSTDVEFAAENQTSTTPTMAAEADLASGGWDPAGASPPHDHGEEEQPYVTPYETFNVDIESSRLTYTQAMDNSADTMAAVYGSSEMEQASGKAQGVYAYAPYQAGAPEAVEGESEDDSDSDSEDEEDQPVIRQRSQTKNWNEQFQRLLSLEPSAHKFAEMARLAHDFVFAAETYGKIIISELGLHESKKTIKPIAVGGQAGGEKYIVQGIFFKFATDIFGIYGGDEYAMKAASHDLKGLIHYYSCQIPGLHVPLMALIDYLGFRLIAITILPINAGTLRYGSCDAGVTIHCEDPLLNAMMKQAARKMHLRGHYVGTPEGLGKKIYGPVDIEAHKGTDDRYYVVDFARTFPPERPDAANVGRKGIILYNLLRPELVKSNKVPLSSDAYTIWARADSKKDLYNLQVTEATERLFKEVIPQVAARLNELQESADKGKTHLDLIEVLHSAGVNVRHLGKVRQLVDPKLQQTTLIEACPPLPCMVARIVRKQIAEKFRKKTRAMGLPTEEPQKMAAVKHLNKLLGRHRNSNYYWRTLKRSLIKKFSNCLLAHELAAGYDLRQSLDIIKFFDRLRALSPNTIPLTEEAAKDFGRAIQDNAKKSWGEWVPNFKFLLSDMTALHATVKHMNLIDIAEASAMFYEGLEEKGYDQTRLLIQGMGKFQIASRKMPFLNVDTIILLGDMLVAQANNSSDRAAVSLILSNALIAYQTALNIQPSNTKCIIGVGNIHARREQWTDAIATYKHAIEVEPTALAYLQLAKAYKGKGTPSGTALAAAEECLRKAVAVDPTYYEALLMLAELIITSTYLRLVDNNVSEVDEATRQTLAEVGGMYESALSFRPNDDAAYDFVDKMIAHVVNPNPKAYRWFDLSLALLWHVVEASPAFRNLVSGKLANVDALHFRHCQRVLTDPVFRGIAWASPAIHTLVLEANEMVTEETMLAWLDHHPVQLREFSLKGCTTQFSSALLLKLASLPRHANALETLRLPGLAVTTEALLASFGARATKPAGAAEEVVAGDTSANVSTEADTSADAAAQEGDDDVAKEKNTRWSRLATLDISQIPEGVDDAVIVEVARLPALTALEYSGATAVTSAALEHLPSQLTSVSFGGAVSLSGLTALAKRCSGITRLSLKGVTGLPAEDAFKLAPLLPALTHYQIPTGNVYLYSGTKSFEVVYSDRGTIRFHIPNGPDLYQLRTQHQTVMEGPDGFSLTISNMPHNKMIADKGTVIARASFAPAVGWNVATVVGGLSTVSLIQYQQMTRTYVIQPRLVDVNYQPQLGQARLYIRPGTNITLLLALFGIAFAVK